MAIEKCPECVAERPKITSTTVNVRVRGEYIGSSTRYDCKICGTSWKEKHQQADEVTYAKEMGSEK